MFRPRHRLPTALWFTVMLSGAARASDIPIGVVERLTKDPNLATVAPVPNRPSLAPEELVVFLSSIPGIDEGVESGKGHVRSTYTGAIVVEIDEGDPAIGDEVAVLRGQFASGAPPVDDSKWAGMATSDLEAPGNEEYPGALCTLATHYELGFGGKEKSLPTYLRIAKKAMGREPSGRCAESYASKLIWGDVFNRPPLFRADLPEAEVWARYAAEKGNLSGMLTYSRVLIEVGRYDEAEEWVNKVLGAGDRMSASSAEGLLAELKRLRLRK